MNERFKQTIASVPYFGVHARLLYRFIVETIPWFFKRRRILKNASKDFPFSNSLDVSRIYGVYIFHNKANSLVKRGCDYEPDVQCALLTLVGLDGMRNRQTVFADIGANIGLHTFFLKSRYPAMTILAFDPSPNSWRYMELSLKYNHTSGVQLNKFALSNVPGTFDFCVWGEESSADSLCNTHRVQGVPGTITVDGKVLDDIPEASKITVIKMDCEGAEYSILQGARNIIRNNQPFIILELYQNNFESFKVHSEDIFRLLNELQYNIFTVNFEPVGPKRFMELQAMHVENYVLLPRKLFGQA